LRGAANNLAAGRRPAAHSAGGFVLRFAGELGGFPRNGATAVGSPELM